MSSIAVALWVLNTQQVTSGWYYTIVTFLIIDAILCLFNLVKVIRD